MSTIDMHTLNYLQALQKVVELLENGERDRAQFWLEEAKRMLVILDKEITFNHYVETGTDPGVLG